MNNAPALGKVDVRDPTGLADELKMQEHNVRESADGF